MIQAMGGLMSITGYSDTDPGGGPLRVGVPISDILAGMYAVIAVLAALAHRQRTGEGQYIDIALMDATVATLANQAMNYLATGESPARIGNTHPNIVPYQAFVTADGYIVVAVGNDGQFVRFCEVIEMPGLARDSRFATNIERVRNRQALIPVLEEVMRGRGAGEWYEMLDAAGIPCGPINNLEQVFADPQVQARGMKVDLEHPLCGTVPQVGSPLKLSATPVACDTAPPLLGEHTDEILRGLDLSEAEIGRLRKEGVV
jgi:crotonobetainyl-CoA:carnitine CoA-transferase CaiB-like acyl-CoA transferase